ncbi:3-oxoacyl-(acyl carrier protein) reductase [Penicillium macrosclerotiorum]|uniref:3-oxoacyl-(acyl carrier protein) reductase n=1 Tax=Penicillium macrosclerotiorum TaxID=303699 RepID=UPI00254760A2|nr:3-oxoacyl-(acyl carrier protein) reductase [Penicillium macrosclerotiorum]KAJ5668699.1 3-oxoacyl-(acyl carrier protein) reductase [Penicillium macrosclerotiorum]
MSAITIYPSLRDKVVLISGGAEGIGAAAVELFCRNHARVVFLDIGTAPAEALIAHVKTSYPDVPAPVFLHCDVTDLARVKDCADKVIDNFGTIHVLVNNAWAGGPGTKAPTSDITPESFEVDVNGGLRHQFFLTQAIVPAMRRQRAGSIINMGSISWCIAATETPIYSTCKAAILGMTRVHSKEFGPDGIRVNSVMPGSIATRRQKEQVLTDEYRDKTLAAQSLKRVLEPADVAPLIVFLASDDASAITGGSHVVDGGWVSNP